MSYEVQYKVQYFRSLVDIIVNKRVVYNWTTPKVLDLQSASHLHEYEAEAYLESGNVYKFGMNFSSLIVNLVLKRKITNHLITVYAPSCLVVILSWFSFMLKLESKTGRTLICITSILALLTQYTSNRNSLPACSYITAKREIESSLSVSVASLKAHYFQSYYKTVDCVTRI
ncbi:glycine receptor subunit alpha-2-like protein [Leptotrombidium deliense]|uniref:Glycine receptor subunit alpha-2-like protein n=1 Tax=Leptotrombidium deliense TaxID=299467 RepID=A0A443SJD7_9ACAR|nr:glycine receptor subunit alpha-2-like protein [Leptotrombidium deliense]